MTNPTKFRLPPGDVFEFVENMKTWANENGKDPRSFIGEVGMETTNLSSPVVYNCYVDESFLQQFPKWNEYVTP